MFSYHGKGNCSDACESIDGLPVANTLFSRHIWSCTGHATHKLRPRIGDEKAPHVNMPTLQALSLKPPQIQASSKAAIVYNLRGGAGKNQRPQNNDLILLAMLYLHAAALASGRTINATLAGARTTESEVPAVRVGNLGRVKSAPIRRSCPFSVVAVPPRPSAPAVR